MITTNIPLSQLEPNRGQVEGLPKNPRILRDERFKALKKSIEDDPEMLELRELLVYPIEDGQYVVIGGNMRLRVLQDLKAETAPCKVIPAETSVEKLKAYATKDNVGFGDWDWEALEKEWDQDQLIEWGLELPDNFNEQQEEEKYTKKITPPIYNITGEKPALHQLFDVGKTRSLQADIESSDIPEDVKMFLRSAAHRHTVFNYHYIAEYYAHAPAAIQRLMEESALVIIDFKQAIESGFVKMSESLAKQYEADYGKEEAE